MEMNETLDTGALRDKLNGETAKLQWNELERHFASGAVVKVAAAMDLVEAAVAMARDDTQTIKMAMDAGRIARASAEDAEQWARNDQTLWAVVVAPWVLVQEVREH